MCLINFATLTLVQVILLSVGIANAGDHSGSPHVKILESLVLVTAKAQIKSNSSEIPKDAQVEPKWLAYRRTPTRSESPQDPLPDPGSFRANSATGFLVSEDGVLITNYHLLGNIGDFDWRTLSIKARVGGESATEQDADILDVSVQNDILVLKIAPLGPGKYYHKVALAEIESHDLGKEIYTSGFTKNGLNGTMAVVSVSGSITAKSGPFGYLWTTNLNFEDGQSGSPVYNESGAVIAVAKGNYNSLNYIIPIELADILLPYVRFKQMRDSVTGPRSHLTWDGKLQGTTIELTYDSLMTGGSAINEVEILATGIGVPQHGRKQVETGKIFGERLKPISKYDGEPSFEVLDVIRKVNSYAKENNFKSIKRLSLKITPIYRDNKSGRNGNINIDLGGGPQ